jgi:hypothetical protein
MKAKMTGSLDQIVELSPPEMNCLQKSKRLSLQMIQTWASTVLRELPLSLKEVNELDDRTNAACEKYGWHELGRHATAQGEDEMGQNMAYLMLRHELSFRAAAYEYLGAIEKGCRKVAVDAELESTAADLIRAIDSCAEMARSHKTN